MPELATLAAFLLLAALLVCVILRVPLPTADHGQVIDLRDKTPAFMARLVFVDAGIRTVTIDGVTAATGHPFALEVRRAEGWEPDEVDRQLAEWAAADAVVEIRLWGDDHDCRRAWISNGEAAIDLPVAGVLGVQSARQS